MTLEIEKMFVRYAAHTTTMTCFYIIGSDIKNRNSLNRRSCAKEDVFLMNVSRYTLSSFWNMNSTPDGKYRFFSSNSEKMECSLCIGTREGNIHIK